MPSNQILWRFLSLALLLVPLIPLSVQAEPPPRKTENVLVVTLDGFRWQELFGGADETLLDEKLGGVRDLPGLKRRYRRDTAQARREALLPFLWGTVAKQGQIFGNPALGRRPAAPTG